MKNKYSHTHIRRGSQHKYKKKEGPIPLKMPSTVTKQLRKKKGNERHQVRCGLLRYVRCGILSSLLLTRKCLCTSPSCPHRIRSAHGKRGEGGIESLKSPLCFLTLCSYSTLTSSLLFLCITSTRAGTRVVSRKGILVSFPQTSPLKKD
jgi:hypothetical protein